MSSPRWVVEAVWARDGWRFVAQRDGARVLEREDSLPRLGCYIARLLGHRSSIDGDGLLNSRAGCGNGGAAVAVAFVEGGFRFDGLATVGVDGMA